ncbi:hypothetical protein ACFLSX_04710 [Calditrichota bacterium]
MKNQNLFTAFFGGKAFLVLFLITLIMFSTDEPIAGANDVNRHFFTQLEFGPVWQGLNDVQIPNDKNGTRFSLADLVGSGPYPAVRLYFTWRISNRHDIRLLLAPLSYTKSGTFSSPVTFAGKTYNPSQVVDATYKFNSWRLTYRYKFYHGEQWYWWVGFTAKIRDAKIKLNQSGLSSEKTDIGFVPLLHIRGEYHFDELWWFLLDIDALAGGPGRAEDGTLQIGYNLNDQWSISAGYRTIEGGADVDEVYNFAWLHYLITSVNFTF